MSAGFPIERARVQAAIRACRFERLTGRARGKEDISSHERKGIVGDWRNYFTDRVKGVFKERFGPLLLCDGLRERPQLVARLQMGRVGRAPGAYRLPAGQSRFVPRIRQAAL